jgi:hypothetical protein
MELDELDAQVRTAQLSRSWASESCVRPVLSTFMYYDHQNEWHLLSASIAAVPFPASLAVQGLTAACTLSQLSPEQQARMELDELDAQVTTAAAEQRMASGSCVRPRTKHLRDRQPSSPS